ncbi:hypothetical protein [Actinokineospora bangkokensis]|uniref:Secreted protein n=1 Tax=Actinokineospora bangkokensis TaxID=1193682 RepID=A0A1Q9LCF0_9PSEU|nr:hypothetical protein [Actinokineospora bangkokensis]OLR89685.1 hypothetical protein BJP25_01205 [Actinokineospora bangkokensis]
MNTKLTRFVAAVVAGSALALGGAGIAEATTASPAPVSDQARGDRLNQLTASLYTAAKTGDTAGVSAAVDGIRTVLGSVRSRSGEVAKADAQAAEIQRALPLPGLPTLPPLPGVGVITGLVPGLIATLTGLLSGLFGVIPVPLPVDLGSATGGLPAVGGLGG